MKKLQLSLTKLLNRPELLVPIYYRKSLVACNTLDNNNYKMS